MKPAIDLRHLSAIGGHQDPELRGIIDEFVDELDPILQQARSLIARPDAPAQGLRDVAHRIRGLAGSFGFRPLADLGALRDRPDPEGSATDWLADLEREIARAKLAWTELKAPAP